ncbi:GDSL-type esterase/lipase family protein [Isoptericola sp. NPDC019571]|uniref:GDSL-type esterase/lipase family protein n=1 Tax=Isoptericola sp. NPDC019571 TaxID=3364008 RepID=UPI0037AFFB1E
MKSAHQTPRRPAARPARRALAAGATTVGLVLAGLSATVGAASGAAAADVPAPTAVRVAHAVDGALSMRWNAVEGAAGYVLSRSDAVDGEYAEVARTDERTVYATDDVDTTAVHYYRAQAIGADGTLSAPSAVAVGTLVGDGVADPEIPEGGLTLDFGNGATAAGATRIVAGPAYSKAHRVGFVDPAQVTPARRDGGDPLRSDLVRVGDTELVVDLPDGDYTVGVVAGDPEAATDIAITAEQMAKVPATERAAGEFLETEFDIALVDGQLNLDFAGAAANLAALTITPQAPREAGAEPTVYVTGDSTVQTYTDYWAPQAGWGQMLGRFLSDGVTVDNHAIGGRSSKNFISQGRLDEVLRQIRPGDYLYVQFGHNDNSYGVDDRYAAPADYRNYLRTFVEGATQRGATPILVTPVSRRSFDASGHANVSFPQYVEQARALAEETGTPLVDLSASSRAYLDEIGPEAARSVFLWVPAGVYPARPDGTQDDTHFQEYGAIQMARLVAQDTAGLDVPLADEVVEAEPPAEVPAAPTGLAASAVSGAGATLTWDAVDGADIYRVLLKDADAGDDAYALRTTSTIGRVDLTGLESGASYDVRVVAVNGRGDSAPSEALRLTTKEPLYRFDVQPAGAVTMDGYLPLDGTTLYAQGLGYGFTSATGPGGRDRGTGFDPVPTALQRDFLLPSASTPIAVDVEDGTYSVAVEWGDMLGTAGLAVTLEGEDRGSANAGRGTTSTRVLAPVEVTDGRLDVVASGWLNGLTITRLDDEATTTGGNR